MARNESIEYGAYDHGGLKIKMHKALMARARGEDVLHPEDAKRTLTRCCACGCDLDIPTKHATPGKNKCAECRKYKTIKPPDLRPEPNRVKCVQCGREHDVSRIVQQCATVTRGGWFCKTCLKGDWRIEMKFREYAMAHDGECDRCSLLNKFVRELINKARLVARVHQFNDGTYLIGRLPQKGETERPYVWKKGKVSDLEEDIRNIRNAWPLGRVRPIKGGRI